MSNNARPGLKSKLTRAVHKSQTLVFRRRGAPGRIRDNLRRLGHRTFARRPALPPAGIAPNAV